MFLYYYFLIIINYFRLRLIIEFQSLLEIVDTYNIAVITEVNP